MSDEVVIYVKVPGTVKTRLDKEVERIKQRFGRSKGSISGLACELIMRGLAADEAQPRPPKPVQQSYRCIVCESHAIKTKMKTRSGRVGYVCITCAIQEAEARLDESPPRGAPENARQPE